MSVVAVAVVLAAVVILLLRTRQLGFGSAILCVALGLVLGATPIGPAINAGLTAAGSWVLEQVSAL